MKKTIDLPYLGRVTVVLNGFSGDVPVGKYIAAIDADWAEIYDDNNDLLISVADDADLYGDLVAMLHGEDYDPSVLDNSIQQAIQDFLDMVGRTFND